MGIICVMMLVWILVWKFGTSPLFGNYMCLDLMLELLV